MRDENKVGNAFAKALQEMLDRKPRRTVAAAAGQLGVSRQAFHSYLKGTLPRSNTLNRAVHMWDLKLDLGTYTFGKGAFGSAEERNEPVPETRQPTLWEALDAVREEDMQVTMKRVGKVLRVDVKIEIPA